MITSDDNGRSRRDYALIFRALGDETRQGILLLLSEKPLSVNEIVANFTLKQPTISRHLAVLKQAGLVVSKRSQQKMIYHLVPRKVSACCDGFKAKFRN